MRFSCTPRSSSTHGGVVPGFFSRAWGYGGTPIDVQSIAMAWNYPVTGFKPPGNTPGSSSRNANLLPIVLDKDTWKAMMAKTTTDQYTYNASTNTVTSGPDTVTESKLYPVASGDPGNWGTINVGVTDNSTSILTSQILYGITPSQLATYPIARSLLIRVCRRHRSPSRVIRASVQRSSLPLRRSSAGR